MKFIFTIALLIFVSLFIKYDTNAQSSAEAIIIEQPKDIIECEGSLDQYFFVIAAPSDRQFKIAYRWVKDGHAITNWIADFGQLTFDTLKFGMSGVYNAELFAFDPNWVSAYGNPFNYDSARVSPIVSSEKANLYVLQHPSFMKVIPDKMVALRANYSMTFEANIYGEHNMDNPTYWTQIQWFKDSIALKDDGRIVGSQSSILTISNVQQSDYSKKYRVRLIGNCDTVWSNEFAIYDEPRVYWWGVDLYDSGCIYHKAQFSNFVYCTFPEIPLKFQWYMDGKILNDIPGIVEGSTNDTLSIYLDTNNNFNYNAFFRCKIWPEGYPQNYIIGIECYLDFTLPPTIRADLDSVYTVEEGGLLRFGFKATGTDIRYYWKKDNEDWFLWDDTLSLGNIRLDQAGKYRAMVVNICDTVYTRVAEVIVTKKTITTGVESENTDINIYPNPVMGNSTINIRSEYSQKASVVIFDMLGNTIATLFNGFVNAGELNTIHLNVNDLNISTGTYYITFTMGDKVQTKQITVVR